METILELLKLDLGITHNERDTYFNALICTAVKELKARGIDIDVNVTEDQILIADYSAWTYRKRQEDVPLARNLEWRIRNRIVKKRAEKTGRNISKNETIIIPAHNIPAFKPAKTFVQEVKSNVK